MTTQAAEFAAKCETDSDLLYFEFDPQATEDQVGEVGIITFADGSKFYNDPTTGKTWTQEG